MASEKIDFRSAWSSSARIRSAARTSAPWTAVPARTSSASWTSIRSALATWPPSPFTTISWPRATIWTSSSASRVRRWSSLRPSSGRRSTSGASAMRRVTVVASFIPRRVPPPVRTAPPRRAQGPPARGPLDRPPCRGEPRCPSRPALLDVDHPDPEVAEQHGRDRGWRIRHGVSTLLGLREGDDVTDRVDAGQDRDEPVQPQRDASHRGRPELEGVEQEPELRAGLRLPDAEQFEDLLLDRLLMDADRATADLLAVQHEVIRLGQRASGIGFHQRHVLVAGCRERVVHRVPALLGGVVFEAGEVDDPRERPPVGRDQAVTLGELHSEAAEHGGGERHGVAAQQELIPGTRPKSA